MDDNIDEVMKSLLDPDDYHLLCEMLNVIETGSKRVRDDLIRLLVEDVDE